MSDQANSFGFNRSCVADGISAAIALYSELNAAADAVTTQREQEGPKGRNPYGPRLEDFARTVDCFRSRLTDEDVFRWEQTAHKDTRRAVGLLMKDYEVQKAALIAHLRQTVDTQPG